MFVDSSYSLRMNWTRSLSEMVSGSFDFLWNGKNDATTGTTPRILITCLSNGLNTPEDNRERYIETKETGYRENFTLSELKSYSWLWIETTLVIKTAQELSLFFHNCTYRRSVLGFDIGKRSLTVITTDRHAVRKP